MSVSSPVGQATRLPNEHLATLDADFLFHLEIPLHDPQLMNLFQNVKFVCLGGTASRMKSLALYLQQELRLPASANDQFDFSFQNERYSGFKVGPVFCVSHGIGMSSISVVLHEVFKLLQKAACCDVTVIRIGTCGGIGVVPGSVVVSTGSLTAGFEPVYTTTRLGKPTKLATHADLDLVSGIRQCHRETDDFRVVTGKTYCAEDFYQGQGRLDGSFCDYTRQDRDDFLRRLQEEGVVNIEMESAAVLAMSQKVGLRAAVVCSVIVDRLKCDLPTLTEQELKVAQNNAIVLVSRYIRDRVNN